MMGVVSLMRGCDDYKVRDWVVSDLCFLSSFPCTGRLLATKYRNVHSLYNIYLLQYCSYVLPWAVTSGLPTLTLLKSHQRLNLEKCALITCHYQTHVTNRSRQLMFI